MAESRTYNTFFKGIQQDNYLTNGANFIEGNNIDGLVDGYGVYIGPKVDNQLLTSTTAMRSIAGIQDQAGSFNSLYAGGDGGNIYRLDTIDNTPTYTLVNTNDIIKIVLFSGDYYFFYKANPVTDPVGIAKISRTDADDDNWLVGFDESWLTNILHFTTPPTIEFDAFLYIGDFGRVQKSSGTLPNTSVSFIEGYVMGITKQGTQLKIYDDIGNVYFWDGDTANSFTASQKYSFRVANVENDGDRDYITAENGDLYITSGYSKPQRIVRKKSSKRLDDNSVYQDKFNFAPLPLSGNSINLIDGDVYLISTDTTPGIYKYGAIIEGLVKGMNKIITKTNDGTAIDEFYDMFYYGRTQKKLYFTYKAGSAFGIDYIDLNANTTAKDGSLVSDIFTGGTTLKKQIDKLRITTSNTSGSNYIKLYFRKDNASTWTLARTINNATDTIDRASISEVTGNFIDIQFKVELHNDNQDDTPPIVHELYLEYTVNKNNG